VLCVVRLAGYLGIATKIRTAQPGNRIPVGARYSLPVQTGPGAQPASCTIGTGSFPGKNGRGVTLNPHPPLIQWSRRSRPIRLLPLWFARHVQSQIAFTVHLYLYSPYGPYSLYRASVPVQYSYTSTPTMDRTACTEPQCLYSTAIPLLPLWTVQPVQTLSACTVQLYLYSPSGPHSLYRASAPVPYGHCGSVHAVRSNGGLQVLLYCTGSEALYRQYGP
jgi:hypothetical protein